MIQFNCLQLHNDFMKIHRTLQPQRESCFFTCVDLAFRWFSLINECVPSAHLEVSRKDRLQVMTGRDRPGTTSDPWRPSWALKHGGGNQGPWSGPWPPDSSGSSEHVNLTISTMHNTLALNWFEVHCLQFDRKLLWVLHYLISFCEECVGYSVKTTIVSSSMYS